VLGPNASTAVAVAALEEALAQSTGSIDVIAYSGGAQAFATAYGELTPSQQSRIGNILYLSPGMGVGGGLLPTTANPANTTVITGTGLYDIGATAWATGGPGTNNIQTSCNHLDLGCLLNAAQAQLGQFAKDGSCTSQDIFLLQQGGSGGGPRKLFFQVANIGGGGDFGGGGDNSSGGGPVPDPVPMPSLFISIGR
jgi:hypothetical protein